MRAYLIDKDKEYLVTTISWVTGVTGEDKISNVSTYINECFETVFNEKEVPKNEVHITEDSGQHLIANLQKSIVWRKE